MTRAFGDRYALQRPAGRSQDFQHRVQSIYFFARAAMAICSLGIRCDPALASIFAEMLFTSRSPLICHRLGFARGILTFQKKAAQPRITRELFYITAFHYCLNAVFPGPFATPTA